jgi:hypothetical protein
MLKPAVRSTNTIERANTGAPAMPVKLTHATPRDDEDSCKRRANIDH